MYIAKMVLKRSNYRRCSIKEGVLKNLAIFQRLQKTPRQKFSCEYCKIFKAPILKNVLEQLFLFKNGNSLF